MPTPRALGLALLSLALACAARAGFERVLVETRHPEQYARTDLLAILSAAWDDPMRAEDVSVDLVLVDPSGRSTVVPAFLLRGSSGASSVWQVRYAPRLSGDYRGRFVLASRGGREESAPLAFTVAASARRGFLRPAGPWIFRFDNGEPFRGLGENLCWESRSNDDSRYFKALHENPRFSYDAMFAALASSGGDFARVWMCPWNLPLEWSRVSPDTDRYGDSPGRFNATAIAAMDRFVETAEAADVYVMLTLDAHVGLLGSDWARSNYNRANGGPCARPADFFTDPAARSQYKDRLRYLVARWGYSPHLAVWELFNEVDNAMYAQKPLRITDPEVTEWHAEMATYLKSIDPYGHLVTTSISHRTVHGLFELPSIDFSQRHVYRDTARIPEAIREAEAESAKPCVVGEFSYEWDWSKDFNAFAPEMERDFKQGLWLGLFSPTPILPMSWWWEFFDARGVTPYLASVREVRDRMLASGKGSFEPVACSAPGLTCLAVRCGAVDYALLFNPTNQPAHVTVTMAATASAAQAFDPEAREWRQLGPLRAAPGGGTCLGTELEPGRTAILELR